MIRDRSIVRSLRQLVVKSYNSSPDIYLYDLCETYMIYVSCDITLDTSECLTVL